LNAQDSEFRTPEASSTCASRVGCVGERCRGLAAGAAAAVAAAGGVAA